MGREVEEVLHLCAGNLYGGVERIVAECVQDRALCTGMQPSVAICFEGRLGEEIDASGATCVRLGAVRASRPWSILRARRRLAHVLRAQEPAAVICHSSWIFGLAAPVVRRTRSTLVLWLHDRVSGTTWPERWAKGTRPDRLIANSRFTAASVPALYPGLSASVLHAPVRADRSGAGRAPLRDSLGVDQGTPVVVTASRFEAWKGHAVLLAALAQVQAPWQLWIAGAPQRPAEAALERGLRERASALGIGDRVRFLGERRDVAACFRAADIHCQPNTGAEPFGLVFVEALYAGIPVVTTAMGGALEIVTDGCGILVPPDDEGAVANALRRLLTDRDTRARLGAAGPARARALCDPARQLTALAAIVAPRHRPAVPA